MDELYFYWLMDQIGEMDGMEKMDGYSELCRVLHGVPFLPTIAMDWNRNDEGLNLGGEWAEATYDNEQDIIDAMVSLAKKHENGCCTMLEILVVMSRRIHYELIGSEYDGDISKWFHELIENCGLDTYCNTVMDEDYAKAQKEITDICGRLIFHQYGWDGENSLFPLIEPEGDQRKAELLTQMNRYINEKYNFW